MRRYSPIYVVHHSYQIANYMFAVKVLNLLFKKWHHKVTLNEIFCHLSNLIYNVCTVKELLNQRHIFHIMSFLTNKQCHSTEETQSINPHHRKSSTGLILSSSATGFLREVSIPPFMPAPL